MNSANVLLAGLPESGKSTYIAAAFNQMRMDKAGSLTLTALPDDLEYLVELEKKWLSLESLERSVHPGPKEISLLITDRSTNEEIVVEIPDITGEDYRSAWQYASWDEGVRQIVERADGILLFVRTDDVREAHLIDVAELPAEESNETNKQQWDPLSSPTQAILCDLLEQISHIQLDRVPPIAVVCSAWDKVADIGLDPAGWLGWQMPLLDQWLRSQQPPVRFQIFGVSAQGGDLHSKEQREALKDRIVNRPVPEGAVPVDEPLRWLLSELLR